MTILQREMRSAMEHHVMRTQRVGQSEMLHPAEAIRARSLGKLPKLDLGAMNEVTGRNYRLAGGDLRYLWVRALCSAVSAAHG
jgi:hypothetical protein